MSATVSNGNCKYNIGAVIAAGGDYDDKQKLNIQLCLSWVVSDQYKCTNAATSNLPTNYAIPD